MESNLRQDVRGFLSSNTQDFIEVENMAHSWTDMKKFLSSNTQDFIEVGPSARESASSP